MARQNDGHLVQFYEIFMRAARISKSASMNSNKKTMYNSRGYDFVKGYMCWDANLQTGGILKSKSPNAQHRTPISLTTLQAIVTLSGNTIPMRIGIDLVKVLVIIGRVRVLVISMFESPDDSRRPSMVRECVKSCEIRYSTTGCRVVMIHWSDRGKNLVIRGVTLCWQVG